MQQHEGNHRNRVMNAVFNNMYQKGLENLNTESFKVTSKPVHRAPEIESEFTVPNPDSQFAEVWYLLKNGNSILKEKYDSMWHPVRTAVLKKGTKGENQDKTKIK